MPIHITGESVLVGTITVCGMPHGVYVCDDLYMDGGWCYGALDYRQCNVYLNRQQSYDQMRETLIHECIHAIESALAIPLDEDDVRRLGRGIYDLLESNPDMFDLLPVDSEATEGE